MRLTWDDIKGNATAFSKRWKDGWDEKSEAQSFVRDFLAVFGVSDPAAVGRFEERALRESGKGFMDYFWAKQIAIEMKTKGKDLNKAYEQLKDYIIHLPAEEMPDLLMVSDFENIVLYRRTTTERFAFKTKDLHKNIKRFANIAGYETTRAFENQVEVNVKAAEKMAKLHDALKEHGYEGHELEVYLVRILFCLFADDTGIFPSDSFINYLTNSKEDGSDLSDRMSKLFEVLNMPEDVRAKRTLLSADLRQFRYINGGLFAARLAPADFNAKMRGILLDCCNFDWNRISPAIFGAMFQGVMDKDQRRELGAHYTSEENILKLINSLFMDELWQEYDRVKTDPVQLDHFHDKISRLKFLDPACGCGNFLIITYRELRILELELLKMKVGTNQLTLDISHLLKVTVEQFYGIEYEDFPCQIAQVGMWLMDHQMNIRAAEQFGMYYARLPLTQSATIVNGNALTIDWESVVPKHELSYILGNPPFVGARVMSEVQKADMLSVFDNTKGVGNLDYVTAWYKKAAELMQNTTIKTAFVSTNSITQGEQVSILWKPLIEEHNVVIDFGYRTFKWHNEAKGKAAVHCVIIGFGIGESRRSKHIIDSDGTKKAVKAINPYLVEAPTVFLENRTKPICNVPEIGMGNQPIDDGNYLFTESEMNDFIKSEPMSEKWFRPWLGADEFINGHKRFCLWLGDCPPSELRKMPEVMKRVEAVRKFRMESKRSSTNKIADTPTRFQTENMPSTNYIVLPEVSSERRRYIPFGFLSPSVLCSNKLRLMPNGTLYHFGVLTSNVHMAWTRAVCGRLEMRYQYSINIVYNNFPWPDVTDEQKAAIEKAAQGVLDTRALFPDCSLADLYDPLATPAELIKAHKNLDRAVMTAYGFTAANTPSEAACVAHLMEMYKKLAEGGD